VRNDIGETIAREHAYDKIRERRIRGRVGGFTGVAQVEEGDAMVMSAMVIVLPTKNSRPAMRESR